MVRAAKMTDADVVTGFCSNFLGEWNFACGNAFDTGFMPPPFEGFGACDTNAGMGLCEDPAVSSLMSEGCKLACGLCPADIKHISLAAGDVGGAGYKINYMAKANFLAKVSTLRKVHGTIKEIAPKNAPYVDWVSVCV
jgi:hypothetical protein